MDVIRNLCPQTCGASSRVAAGGMTDRITSLDVLRGIAVMGILLMNIIAFSMPEPAYMSPVAFGDGTAIDVAGWAVMFVLVDGKMRGFFTILFGASTLIVWQRAQEASGNGASVHLKRMAWLLVFGFLHFFLIWTGDILTLYALCGMVALFLVKKDVDQLWGNAIALFAVHFIIFSGMCAVFYVMQHFAMMPGATAESVQSFRDIADGIQGTPDSLAKDVALYQSGWLTIVQDTVSKDAFNPIAQFLTFGVETLGLMALGMMYVKNGFLTGQWGSEDYKRTMIRCYGIGLPPLILMAIFQIATGFDPLNGFLIILVLSMPFSILVTVGHAALILFLLKERATSPLTARIAATGRVAFSNYIATSILMTGLFYGWGLGQFGQWARWQVYLVVPFMWIAMLIWSKPWLDRFQYGPLEWVWRSLSRWKRQPLRRISAPTP
jgi:uncharacterized protein